MTNQRVGFTIIELLIAVSFILLFSGLSIGYYNQYTERTKLENTGKRVMTALALVRQMTISGDSNMCAPNPLSTPPASASFYTFRVKDQDAYAIEPSCLIGTPKPVNYTNDTNIIFVTPLPPKPPLPVVTFLPVNGSSVCTYIYIKNTALGTAEQCRYVKISQSGSVSDGVCSTGCSCPTSCP